MVIGYFGHFLKKWKGPIIFSNHGEIYSYILSDKKNTSVITHSKHKQQANDQAAYSQTKPEPH